MSGRTVACSAPSGGVRAGRARGPGPALRLPGVARLALLAPVVLLSVACGGAEEAPPPAPVAALPDTSFAEVPLRGLPGLPDTAAAPARSFSGPTLLHVRRGDSYGPALSPSGERVAWGELTDEGELPLTVIRARPVEMDDEAGPEPDEGDGEDPEAAVEQADTAADDRIPDDRAWTLLDREASARYAAYGTFLENLEWDGEDRVRATISDGDVGLVELVLEVPRGDTVSESHREGDVALAPEDLRLLDRLSRAFPDVRREVLESSFHGLLIRRDTTGVLLQKNWVDTDRHVWYMDPERGVSERVVELPDTLRGNLRGGVGSGRTTAFLLVIGDRGHLLLHRPGRVRILDSFEVGDGRVRLRPVERVGERVFFLVEAGGRGRSGTDRLYLLTDEGVVRVSAPGGLAGADVSLDGSRIVYSYWSGDERDLRVAGLRLP